MHLFHDNFQLEPLASEFHVRITGVYRPDINSVQDITGNMFE